jgi:small redox-active disulfide protein 2
VEIKVLGSGCASCKKLEELARAVVSELGVQAQIDKVSDFREIMSYEILATPGLVIDGQVKAAGRIPSKAEITSWIATAAL